MKVGKMRAAFGKVNTLHNHVLPWTDRPLVTQQPGRRRGRHRRRGHLGGAADSEPVAVPRSDRSGVPRRFGRASSTSSERSDLSYVGHLRGYQDITENTQHRSRASRTRAATTLAGIVDGAGPRPVHHDAVRHRRDVPLAAAAAVDLPLVRRPHGVDLEPARAARRDCRRRRATTSRATTSSRAAGLPACASTAPIARDDASLVDTGAVAASLTYWPSEFSQVRGAVPAHQLRRRSDGRTSSCSSSSFPSARTARIRSRVAGARDSERFMHEDQRLVTRAIAADRRIAAASPRRRRAGQAERRHHDRGSGVDRARGRRRPHHGRIDRAGLSGSALRRGEAELHPQAAEGRPADRRSGASSRSAGCRR